MPCEGADSSIVGSCTALPISLLFLNTSYVVTEHEGNMNMG